MKLNKEKFLKTEFGAGLNECVTAWDKSLTELRRVADQEYVKARKTANWCQAQWEVYQAAMRQFYGIEYNFTRTRKYFGVCTEDEENWLFKVKREA